MKFIQISDLHIGKKLGNYSLEDDQRYILDKIIDVVDRENPDAVLIAGDVYDKSIPSGEAVTLFDDFLVKLAQRKVKTFIIAGNHDSAERLAFANRLIEQAGIYLSNVYDGHTRRVTLQDEYGDVNIYMLPFIKPLSARRFFGDAEINDYTDLLNAAVAEMNVNTDDRNVLIAHQFVTGASVSGSEDVTVGGLDNVDSSAFAPFDYVALGHIHGAQNVTDKIRYCGTPLKYSLAEINSPKSVTVVELGAKGTMIIREIPLTPLYEMKEIRGRFDEVISAEWYNDPDFCNDYLHIVLTDDTIIPNAYGRLADVYPRILDIKYENVKLGTNVSAAAADVDNKTPAELIAFFFKMQTGKELSKEQAALINELLGKNKEDTEE